MGPLALKILMNVPRTNTYLGIRVITTNGVRILQVLMNVLVEVVLRAKNVRTIWMSVLSQVCVLLGRFVLLMSLMLLVVLVRQRVVFLVIGTCKISFVFF